VNDKETDRLIRIARLRAKHAIMETAERAKVLMSEAEDLMAGEFEARDQLWAEATQLAEEAARKANEIIVARCVDLGIPAKEAPQLQLAWNPRGPGFGDGARRAELRKVATARLAALTAAAKTVIDRKLLETETALIAGSLESADAKAFLETMPTAEQLMPPLSLDDLGVKTWQPPEGVAAALLTPSTPADRRRRKILRAIEAHPGASDREIGRLAGADGHTVAKFRAAAAEIPAPAAEIRTDKEPDH
jgi:hypothetical protein